MGSRDKATGMAGVEGGLSNHTDAQNGEGVNPYEVEHKGCCPLWLSALHLKLTVSFIETLRQMVQRHRQGGKKVGAPNDQTPLSSRAFKPEVPLFFK